METGDVVLGGDGGWHDEGVKEEGPQDSDCPCQGLCYDRHLTNYN